MIALQFLKNGLRGYATDHGRGDPEIVLQFLKRGQLERLLFSPVLFWPKFELFSAAFYWLWCGAGRTAHRARWEDAV